MRSFAFTAFLLVLAIVAGGMVVVRVSEGNLHRIFGPPPTRAGDRLYDFDPLLARRIVLSGNGASAECFLDQGRWQVSAPWKDRMDPVFAKAIIAFTLGTRVVDAIPRDELDDVQSGFQDGAIRIRIEDGRGKSLAKYRLGRLTAVTHHDPETGEESPTVFLRPRESGRDDYIYACTGDIHPIFKDGFRHLRDHRPFYSNPLLLQSVRIRNAEGELLLSRAAEKDAPWRITKPLELRTDPVAVRQLLTGLYTLRAKNVLNRAEVTLPPDGENAAESISLRHFGEPTERTLRIYPPASPEAETQYAVVDDRPDAVFELLRRPLAADGNGQDDMVALATLPDTVNQLRNKTLTNIDINSVQGIRISSATGGEILIARERMGERFLAQLDGAMRPLNQTALDRLVKMLTETPVAAFATDAAGDHLLPYGLDRPALSVLFLAFGGEHLELLFGQARDGSWHAMRKGTTTVLKLDEGFIRKIAMRPWQWRQTTLWSIAPVDLMRIDRTLENQPPLELEYLSTVESWTAREGEQDRSAELATNRANRLLAALLNLEAQEWLAADDALAAAALARPTLQFTLAVKTFDDEGNFSGVRQPKLTIAPASSAPGNRRFYARIDGEPHPFLLNHGIVYQLSMDLFGDD